MAAVIIETGAESAVAKSEPTDSDTYMPTDRARLICRGSHGARLYQGGGCDQGGHRREEVSGAR
jgi:hypothetical protein